MLIPAWASAIVAVLLFLSSGNAAWAQTSPNATATQNRETAVESKSDSDDKTRGDQRIVLRATSNPSALEYRASYAVIVGVNAYSQAGGLPPLEFAVNDARELRDILRDEFGYAPERIRYLTDADAKLDAIRDSFSKWPQKVGIGPDDSLLVFFAGHGLVDSKSNDGYLAAVDSDSRRLDETCLSVAWMRERLAALSCRHKLVVLDSCYSGSLFRRPTATLGDVAVTPLSATDIDSVASANGNSKAPLSRGASGTAAPLFSDNLAYYLRQPAFLGISAGRFTPVADGSGEQRHSVFTASLLRVLKERADSPRHDHAFTFRQVAAQVETLVANTADSRQIPDWGRLGDGDGDFLFRPTKRRETPREVSAARAAIAKRRNYVAAVKAGFAAADTNNMPLLAEQIREARRYLDGEPDFALRYLEHRFQDPRFVGGLGVDRVKSCAFSPTGGRFAALGVAPDTGGALIKVWGIDAGQLQKPIEIRPDVPCDELLFADDDRMILRIGDGESIVMWSISEQRIVGRWNWSLPILRVEISGGILVVGGMRAIAVVDLTTLRTRHTLVGHLGYVQHLAITPDGKFLASAASDDKVLLWNLADGTQVRRSAWQGFSTSDEPKAAELGDSLDESSSVRFQFPQHVEKLGYLRFVSDGVLAVVPQFGKESETWHLATGERRKNVDHSDANLVATQIHAFSRDFAFIQCGDFICARHLGAGVELPSLRLNLYRPQGESTVPKDGQSPSRGGWINDLAVSPDGRWVAAAIADGYLYDLKKRPPAKEVASHVLDAGALAVKPDGTLLVCGGDSGEVLVFQTADGKSVGKLVGHNGNVAHAVFSPDGKTLVTRSVLGITGEVVVWDFSSRTEMFRIPDVGSWSSMPSISPDGRRVAVSRNVLGNRLENDAATYVYDLVQRKKIRDLEGSSGVLYSPEGQLLLCGDAGEPTRRFDGETLRRLEDLQIRPLCFSDDGEYVAAFSRDEGISVIEVRTWPDLELRSRIHPEDDEGVFQSAVAFSRDGRLLTTLRSLTGVELWDTATGNLLNRWRGLFDPRNVCFGAHDELLACASRDQGVWIHRALNDVALRTEVDDLETLTKQLSVNPTDAAILVQRSGLYASRGNISAAVVDLSKALEISSGNAEDYLRLAELYRKLGDKEHALQSIGRYPAWADNDSLRELRFRLLDELGRHLDAVRELTLLLQRNPRDTAMLVRRAEARIKAGGVKEALADLDQVAQIDPATKRLASLRAVAKLRLNDLDGALTDCGDALRNNPVDVEALLVRAECRSRRGEAESAFADATEILRLDSEHVEARILQGAYWHDRGNYQTALDLFLEALRRQPDSASARSLKALTLIGLKEFAAAEKEFASLLAQSPKNAYAWNGRAKARMNQSGKEAGAFKDFDEAIRLNPRFLEAFVNRAELSRRTDKLDAALADLGRAIELNPSHTYLYFTRGKLFYSKGDFEAAEADFAKAFQKFPNEEDIVLHAARTLARLGEYETALKQFDRLLDARPENVEYLHETAWQLATIDDATIRNAARAEELALRAVELSRRTDWQSLRALAAARAAMGKFGDAYTDMLAARKLAPSSEHEQLDAYAAQLTDRHAIVMKKPLRRLIQDIRHADSKVSLAAISELGGLGADAAKAVPDLASALDDPKFVARHSAAYALGRIGPPAAAAADTLRRRLTDPVMLTRLFSAWALLKVDAQEKEAVFVLIDALRTETNLELVLELLADVGPRAAPGLSLFIKFASAENVAVRKDALNAIGKLGSAGAKAAPQIEDQLTNADETVRLSAVLALREVGVAGEKVLPVLRVLLAAEKGEVRIVAARVCRDDAEFAKSSAKELIALLGDEFHDIRAVAAETIGKHLSNVDEAIPALAKAVDQPVRVEGRIAAAEALGNIGKKAIPAFRQLLHSSDGNTRFIAAGMLGKLKADAAPLIDELTNLALDETQSPSTREAALATIGLVGQAAEPSFERILPLLSSDDEKLRSSAVRAIGGIGRADHPELVRLLRDKQEHVREAAVVALQLMGESGIKPVLSVVADSKLDSDIRLWAAVRLPRFQSAWVHDLLELCATDDSVTGDLAASTLTFRNKAGDAKVLPAVLVAVSDKSFGVRRCAARTLYQLDAPLNETLPALLSLLCSNNKELVGYAELTLEKYGEPAVPVLTKLQQTTTDAEQREALGRALAAVYFKLQKDAVSKRFEK